MEAPNTLGCGMAAEKFRRFASLRLRAYSFVVFPDAFADRFDFFQQRFQRRLQSWTQPPGPSLDSCFAGCNCAIAPH